jgi:hypothetical protein
MYEDTSCGLTPAGREKLALLHDAAAGHETAAPLAEAQGPEPVEPRALLNGWHAITSAVNLKYADRQKVARLNVRLQGPIKNRGRGTQPMVYKDDLISWWNKLDILQQQLANQRQGAKLSAKAQHPYSRGGAVAPEIGGGIKRRRTRHPKPA